MVMINDIYFLHVIFSKAVVFVCFYIALTVHYTRIKQQVLVHKFIELTKRMHSHQQEFSFSHWTMFVDMKRDILMLYDEITVYNKFWSIFLTLAMVAHISLDTLLGYGWIFADKNATLSQRSFLIFFSIQCFTLILMITYECSMIVYNNAKIYKTIRQFSYTFAKTTNPKLNNLLKVSQTPVDTFGKLKIIIERLNKRLQTIVASRKDFEW